MTRQPDFIGDYQKRNEDIHIMVSSSEKEEIENNSHHLKMSISSYFRFLHNKFGNRIVNRDEKKSIIDYEAIEELKRKFGDG